MGSQLLVPFRVSEDYHCDLKLMSDLGHYEVLAIVCLNSGFLIPILQIVLGHNMALLSAKKYLQRHGHKVLCFSNFEYVFQN